MTGLAEVVDELHRADLRLRRAWPRSEEHLLLDLVDLGDDGRVAAQWFADRVVAERVARATPGAQRRGRLVLQPHGADRRLRGLAGLLRQPDSRLIAHRPERRAVVALDGGTLFAKVVPPSRVARLHHTAGRVAALPIRTPVLCSSETDAIVTTRALPGIPLPDRWVDRVPETRFDPSEPRSRGCTAARRRLAQRCTDPSRRWPSPSAGSASQGPSGCLRPMATWGPTRLNHHRRPPFG